MKTLFAPSQRQANPAATAPARQLSLVRKFVETGDERCPIAGIWSRISVSDQADDPEPAWLAVWRLLPRRAFLPAS